MSRQIAGILCLVLAASIVLADSPPENSIPLVAMNAGQDSTCESITLQTALSLSWRHFDGMWLLRWVNSADKFERLVGLCDTTGLYMVCTGHPYLPYGYPDQWWARYDSAGLWDDSAFIHPDAIGGEIESVRSAETMMADIRQNVHQLDSWNSGRPAVWYYDIFNECPNHQYRNRVGYETWGQDSLYPYDDYMPNMFTQALEQDQVVFEGDTFNVTVPVMDEVDPQGVYSWLLHTADSVDASRPISVTFGTMHRMEDWAGRTIPPPNVMDYVDAPTYADHADAVRAYCDTEYQYYTDSQPPHPAPEANPPQILEVNAYPFRHVSIHYQDSTGTTSTLGDSLDLVLLDHFSEGLDSTYIPAWRSGLDRVYYHPQAFCRSGGAVMWDTTPPPPDSVNWPSYPYRMPSPAEFRMGCGIGLVRGAKGLNPFSLRTFSVYDEDILDWRESGLLDENLIPYDAAYEEWVYRDRLRSDFAVIPPDSIPPWTDIDGNDFDPLYQLPDRPDTTGEQGRERYLEWKFAAYGRLWNSLRSTLGAVARIGPEMYDLVWWDGKWWDGSDSSSVGMYYGDTLNMPIHYTAPEIRVFTDSSESGCWLFYVNRHCRSNGRPYRITIESDSFPPGMITGLALDHSRRFLVPVAEDTGRYLFRDTLDAGHFRLVEFVDSVISRDVRVTEPDVYVQPDPPLIHPIRDFCFTAGNVIDVRAVLYNMGTGSGMTEVRLYDITCDSSQIGTTQHASFSGLSTSGYEADCDTLSFTWRTDSANIGVHVLEVAAEGWGDEPDPDDNGTRFTVLINPRDYATEVLDDAWDMTEADSAGPAWYTDDVVALSGYDTTFTDSISGMFEATLTDPTEDNELRLNVDTSAANRIDTSLYDRLSLAGKADAGANTWVYVNVCWTDENNNAHSVRLPDSLPAGWSEMGPYDLSDLSDDWDDEDVKALWLEISHGSILTRHMRIGWIRLTE